MTVVLGPFSLLPPQILLAASSQAEHIVLTVESNIMVGQDGWAISFWGPPNNHMKQPIWGLNIMLLEEREREDIGWHLNPSRPHLVSGESGD